MVFALILLVILISFPRDVVGVCCYKCPRLGRIFQSFLYHCNMLSVFSLPSVFDIDIWK